jgi:hypothetical protein
MHLDEPEENPDPDNDNGGDDNPPPLSTRTYNEYDSDDEEDGDGDNNNATDPNDAPSGEEVVYHPDSMTSSVQRTHGLRPRKPRDYSHMFSHATVMYHVMTQ